MMSSPDGPKKVAALLPAIERAVAFTIVFSRFPVYASYLAHVVLLVAHRYGTAPFWFSSFCMSICPKLSCAAVPSTLVPVPLW